MVNEYGAKLDRNGYAPSIIQDEADESCFVCYAMGIMILSTATRRLEAHSGTSQSV